MSRREFVWTALAAGGAIALPLHAAGCGSSSRGERESPTGPLLYIAIDSFAPQYLALDSRGYSGGREGDWLTPNVHAFLAGATHFADARCYLPAATDMNHLNAIAGTSSAQTGVLGVSIQTVNWNPEGTAATDKPNLSWTRDDQGRPVDTLFRAWKRKWPQSKVAYVSGKFWVAEMYQTDDSGIDLFVTGKDFPDYVAAPTDSSFYDPEEGDSDARCDPESAMQQAFVNQIFGRDPASFPPDRWVVDAALQVLAREGPDLCLILLAQTDDAQHGLGAAWNPAEFEPRVPRIVPPFSCEDRENPDWQLASQRNHHVVREPILDTLREVDRQFGRLIDGLKGLERYRDATIVLYSDHGHVTHLLQKDWKPEDRFGKSTDVTQILFDAGVISETEKNGNGYFALTGTSIGEIYFRADSLEARRAKAGQAKQVLLAHRAENPETGAIECPWDVLDADDMIEGVPGVSAPGELWHAHFGPNNTSSSVVWPDLILFMRNGWQIVVYDGALGNIGVDLPFPLPPLTIFIGGHGAPDTQPILMAMVGPGIARGKVLGDPGYGRDYRIADLAVTVARRHGLQIESTTVGRDRSDDLAG